MNKYIFLFFISSIFNFNLKADIEFKPHGKNSWNHEWSKAIRSKILETSILDRKIDQADLADLKCEPYNSLSVDEKLDFWVLFLASLSTSESGLNFKVRSKKYYGLLQIHPNTAKKHCGIKNGARALFDPIVNLSCGVSLLDWQLAGAIVRGKQTRPDLENQIFGKNILLWGPLRERDFLGRKRLYQYFLKHIDQIAACQQKKEA